MTWEPNQLKEYVDALLFERDRATDRRHHLKEAHQTSFEASIQKRFDQVNEFRGALDDLGKQMATRRELETAVKILGDEIDKARDDRQRQIDDLRTVQSELRSRLDVGAPQIPELQEFAARTSGRSEGVRLSGAAVFNALIALMAMGELIALVLVTR